MNKQQKKYAASTAQENWFASILTKTKKARLYSAYLLLAVTLVTAFFAHENITINLSKIDNARAEWKIAKAQRTNALNNLKDAFKYTEEFKAYYIEKVKTDKLYAEVKKIEEELSFLGFPNFQYFVGEFGWAFGLFIIGLYLLAKDIIRNSNILKGELLVDATIIAIALFFMTWAFNYKQDFSRVTYIIVSIILSVTISIGTYLIIKKSSILKLKNIIYLLLKGYYKDLEELNLINPWKKKEYKQYRVNLTDKVVEHEQK